MNRMITAQLIRYGVTGVSSVFVYVGLLWGLLHIGSLSATIANATAYLVATIFNYGLNFYWSFSTKRSHFDASWRFLAVVAAGFLLNTAFVMTLTSFDFDTRLSALAFSVMWPVASFTALKLWALK